MILGRYDVAYYRCDHCGFIQTENPYWLDEAYSSAIASTDLGLLERNYRLARVATRLMIRLLDSKRPGVDYGGGYGIFVRLMRDRGLDYYYSDPLAENLFAKGYEAVPNQDFELASAMEVFEHLHRPHGALAELDRLAPNWLVTTEMVPEPVPKISQWWYYMPETGQHVSFYTPRSLQVLAEKYGRRVISGSRGLHFFTKLACRPSYVRWILRNKSSRWFDKFIKRPSLMKGDYEQQLRVLQQTACRAA